VRYVLVGMLGVVALRCRDIQPVTSSSTVQGYQLNGTFITSDGIPIDNADVILSYKYVPVDTTATDTQSVVLVDSLLFVDISVYTVHNVYIRRLFDGFRSPGVIPRARWDGFDNDGNLVPSGKYLIRYTLGPTIAKEAPVLIDGHKTTATDANGQFIITKDNFPIGDVFDIYNNDGTYYKTVQVLSTVDLEFKKLALDTVFSVTLTKDQITNEVFTIQ
jgi:hypothetical protein